MMYCRAVAPVALVCALVSALACGGAIGGADRSLVWYDRDGQTAETVPARPAPYTTIQFEPGEQAIVAAVGGRRPGFARVDLTTGARVDMDTRSPWTSRPSTGLPTHLSRRWIVFDAPEEDGSLKVRIAPREGRGSDDSRPYLDTPFSNSGGRLSVDERWLAYISLESGRPELYASTFPEADARWLISLPDGAEHPVWRADSLELYYWAPGGRLMVAALRRGDRFVLPAMATLVFENPDLAGAPFAATRDSTRFLIAK
jgi:hypothetical protein